MNRCALVLLSASLLAVPLAASAAEEKSCGQQIAEDAKYPTKLAETLTAVADNFTQHAAWVGTKTPEARKEHDAMLRIARMQRELAVQAKKLADEMAAAEKLPVVAHDMSTMPASLKEAMEKATRLQAEFGELLVQGAAAQKASMEKMKMGSR